MFLLAAAFGALYCPAAVNSCGGVLTQPKGFIHTPDFPAHLNVPIRCQWLIDSTGIQEEDVMIVVYFTQLFVTSGLTFTEYASYNPKEPNSQKNSNLLLSITEDNSVTTRWLSTRLRFLVIELKLEQLEGSHLRVLDHLLDVFGFNITYEIVTSEARNDSCSVIDCSFDGDCYIDHDYKEFWCSCFPGFSGPSCNLGPICRLDNDPCLNGGVCRHAGKYPTCTCLEGFTGSRCEVSISDPRCQGDDCFLRCRNSGLHDTPCLCDIGQDVQSDRWRFIITINVDNISSLSHQHPGIKLYNFLEKQIQKFFGPFSLSRFDDLKILNISQSGQVIFHFFGNFLDLSQVRLGQQELSERIKLGEVLLLKSPILLHHERGLRLEDVKANSREVFENDQVLLSCIAHGSEEMEFRWYKDGSPIEPLKGLGGLWMNILPKNSKEEYTAILGIDAAQAVDEGRYTCQVTDWGIEECKSYYLQVQAPPDILVSPMAVSVKKGGNVDLTCVSTNQKVSYTWTRNRNLFRLNPGIEAWEDLKPWGSILRIRNIQKSVTYTCKAQTKATTREKSIHIDLLAPGYCKETEEFEIIWKSTSPGSVAIAECPPGYIGYSTRYCLPVQPGEAHWEKPIFSKCISDFLDRIMIQFQVISRGAIKPNIWMLLSDLYSWLSSQTHLYLGEGEPVVDLLSEISMFVNLTFTSEEVLNVTQLFYANADLLLSQSDSLIHIEKVGKLQKLVNQWSLMWAQHVNVTMAHLVYSEMVIDIRKLSNQTSHEYYIPIIDSYPQWYTAIIELSIISRENKINRISVVNYQNISKFLPKLSSQIMSDGIELLYEIKSNVISISAEGDMELQLDMTFGLNIQNTNKWNLTCARADFIGLEWDMKSCLQVTSAANYSHCICNKPGLYSVLLTKILSDKLEKPMRDYSSMIVTVGCGCCLILSCLTVFLLSCRRVFVKLFEIQFCLAVCCFMAIFFYATTVVPNEDMYLLINLLLELFFFYALSSHLGKLLIIYSEVFYLHKGKSAKHAVFGITSGMAVLPCLVSGSAESFSEIKFRTSWWIPFRSYSFYVVAAFILCAICLFAMLAVGLFRRLHYLKAIKKPNTNNVINSWLGLIKRTTALFMMTVLVAISSLLFVNKPNSVNIYVFSSLSAILGLIIFVCYILLSESALNPHLIKLLKIDTNDQEYNSDSDNNLYNSFTKHGSEAESKDVPKSTKQSDIEMMLLKNNIFYKPKSVSDSNKKISKTGGVKKEQYIDLEVHPDSYKKSSLNAGNSQGSGMEMNVQSQLNLKNESTHTGSEAIQKY